MMLLTLDPERKAIVFGLAAVGLWSTVATAFTLSLQFVSPLVLVTLASAASWLLFALIITATRQWSRLLDATPRDCWIALAIGTLNPGLYYTLLFEAYARLPAQEAMALNYTWALTLPLLAAPLLKQALQRRDIIAALISYVGVFVIATHGEPWTLTLNEPTGIALAMGSTLIWGLCWIANTQHALNPVNALFLNFSAATPMLFVVVYLSDGFQDIPLGGLLGGLYVGIFEMGISFIFWLNAMRLTRSTANISTLIFLSPPISLVLIWLVLGEPIELFTLTGLSFILLGLFWQHRSRS